eukprot:11003276-Heterocapsa_arctica.AAC.1
MSWCDYAPLQPPGSAIAAQGLSPPAWRARPIAVARRGDWDPHPAAGATVATRCPLASGRRLGLLPPPSLGGSPPC